MRFFHRFLFVAFILPIIGVIHCALAPSPDLHHITWLPKAIANWANEYPAFRNFPAFGVVAVSLYFCVFNCLENVYPRKLLRLAFFCSVAVSLFGVLLECLQILLPTRLFDPYDIAWSIAGAFAASILAFFVSIYLIGKK